MVVQHLIWSRLRTSRCFGMASWPMPPRLCCEPLWWLLETTPTLSSCITANPRTYLLKTMIDCKCILALLSTALVGYTPACNK